MVVQEHSCEALLAAGRVEEAAESLHRIVKKTFYGAIGTDRKVSDWVLGNFCTSPILNACSSVYCQDSNNNVQRALKALVMKRFLLVMFTKPWDNTLSDCPSNRHRRTACSSSGAKLE